MNARATLAIVRKDAVEIVLNKSALVTVLSPIFVAVLFAVLNSLLSAKATPVLIFNPGGSAVEQVILDSPLANIAVTRAGSAEQVAAAFSAARPAYALGLAVPANYDADARLGKPVSLALYVSAADVDPATGRLIAAALAGQANAAAAIKVVTVNSQQSRSQPGLGSYLTMFGLMSSLFVGATVVASLLLEEKERGTLRLLLVPPITLADVVTGKLLVGLGYQLLLVLVVLGIQGGYVGAVGLVLVLGLLGSLLGLGLGLLYATRAKNTGAFGAFVGLTSAFYSLPALFVGPIGQALRDSPLVRAMQAFPTYYLAHSLLDALEGGATPGAAVQAVAIVAGCTVLVFGVALWSLRREAALGMG